MASGGRRFPLTLDRISPPARAAVQGPVHRPQRPLREAAGASGGAAPQPSGQGLDSEAVRARMVERLRRHGVEDERVLRAMGAVPRHLFVDAALAAQAYEDTSLPIGWEQTISKPVVVARMMALLVQAPAARQRTVRAPLGRALEIGTGSGYQAAVMRVLATHVTSVERLGPLHRKAAGHLASLGAQGVRLVHADGRQGHAADAPYDSIVAAAGGEDVPQAWLDQLAVGGRIVAPLHDAAASGQMLVVIDRTADGWQREVRDAVHFVPLKWGHS